MVFKGHVKNGVIVLDQGPSLEEGLAVSVRALRQRNGRSYGKPVRESVSPIQPRSRVKSGGDRSALEAEQSATAQSLRRRIKALEKAGPFPTLYETLKPVIGILRGLPKDFAAQHDHYIHGTPKRK